MTWYEKGPFSGKWAIPPNLLNFPDVGPRGLALVSVYGEGKTQPGWGLTRTPDRPGWAENYAAGRFLARPKIGAYEAVQAPFAIVMRSAALVCIDIDEHEGGASGFEGVLGLGDLPPTLAETSRSGGGRHLFYRLEDAWDPQLGFARYDDVIGLAPGVDMRATGCVYHYPTQRWNGLEISALPEQIRLELDTRRTRKINRTTALAAAASGSLDDTEVLIMHDTLIQELAAPIPAGKRNNSLFAIGSKLKLAAVPGWQEKVGARAEEVGLDPAEVAKLIGNIDRYAV